MVQVVDHYVYRDLATNPSLDTEAKKDLLDNFLKYYPNMGMYSHIILALIENKTTDLKFLEYVHSKKELKNEYMVMAALIDSPVISTELLKTIYEEIPSVQVASKEYLVKKCYNILKERNALPTKQASKITSKYIVLKG
jgi:hypothetical protein